ncbi:hypothetical protein NDI52_29170 [Leptolyngbya sp. PL-A3]|uniref:hypothetical protein n=1 Tax=Leptolyngbya sp. PL-A3 TaxID=2933911 RepID=UPI00329A3BCE
MQVVALKIQVYRLWKNYLTYYESVLVLPDQFKVDIRKEFGDLRRHSTWEKAFCRYSALHSRIGLLDADRLIRIDFNFTPDRNDYIYRHQIFDEWLSLPEGPDLIKTGLEILSRKYTQEPREKLSGFLKLIQERQTP